MADATYPSAKLRKLEIAANDAFDTYRELYFEGGVSSAYFWDLEDGAFAGVVLIKKSMLGYYGRFDALDVLSCGFNSSFVSLHSDSN